LTSLSSSQKRLRKKSQKTPSGELDKAVKIMNEYFDEKLKEKQNEIKKSKK
jgi:hypothetical protein